MPCWDPYLRVFIHDDKEQGHSIGSVDTNPFRFQHYDLSYLSLYVNGKQVSSEGLHLDMGYKDTRHGILDALRGIWHSPLDLVIPDNTRYVHRRILRDTLRSDNGPRRVGTNVTP
jgi:hypothetical protein